MTKCQCCKVNHRGRKCELLKSASSPQESNLVKAQKGVTLEIPMDFFNDFKFKGSMFKLKTINVNKERIALKWIRQSHTCGFGKHIETLQHAAENTAAVITSFMKRIDTKGWGIDVVMPRQGSTDKLEIGVEPFIQNTEQFNSNSFWECNARRTYQKLVVALAHFSYAASKGEYVLTNLQGGVDKKRKLVTLLTPNLVSEKQSKFGCMDLGNASGFFARHRCNSFCYDIPRRDGESKVGFRFRLL